MGLPVAAEGDGEDDEEGAAPAPSRLPGEDQAAFAARLRALADPARVAAVLAGFPPAEDIGVRERPETYDPHHGKRSRLPKSPQERLALLRSMFEDARVTVERDISVYNRLRFSGLAAVCDYDCTISSGNDPVCALRTSLRLKEAHISYGLTMMHNLHLDVDAALVALGQPAQQDLF